MKIRPVILSGGSGTRLWPVSRRRFPKQFVNLVGNDCLFAQVLKLVSDRDVFEAPLIVSNVDHKFFVLDVLERLKLTDASVVLEPLGRNTAPAAMIAALHEQEDSDCLHLVMPSDHNISDWPAFLAALKNAARAAEAGRFVLFGITPTQPETGYGYISPGDATTMKGVLDIGIFREKPDAKTATALIAQGALWNSGIFLYDPRALRAEAAQLAPEQIALCQEALDAAKPEMHGLLMGHAAYEKMEDNAFDRLILERTKLGAVVPCSIGWSDVGSWQALWQLAEKDENGNVFEGSVVSREVNNSYVRSDGPTVAILGVDDIAVVVTKDAVLVTPRERSQEVKTLVADVDAANCSTASEHPRVTRPWGNYEGIASGNGFKVKHIVVHPGRSLSLQMHHHRAEHWVVVIGTAKIECNGTEKLLFSNESIFIPQGATHRLSNPGKIDLHLIEVQSGSYTGEDDIVRFADNYGRVL